MLTHGKHTCTSDAGSRELLLVAAINHAYGLQSTIDFIHDIYKPSLLPTAYRLLAEHNATLIAQARESDTDPSSQAFVNYVGRLQEWGMRSGQRIEYRMLPSEGGRKGERLVHIGEIWVGGTKAAQERADTIKGVRQLCVCPVREICLAKTPTLTASHPLGGSD